MDGLLRRKQSFLLRLPPSLREQATVLAQEEGISLNHFIGLALAEKVSRMERPAAGAPPLQRAQLTMPHLAHHRR